MRIMNVVFVVFVCFMCWGINKLSSNEARAQAVNQQLDRDEVYREWVNSEGTCTCEHPCTGVYYAEDGEPIAEVVPNCDGNKELPAFDGNVVEWEGNIEYNSIPEIGEEE